MFFNYMTIPEVNQVRNKNIVLKNIGMKEFVGSLAQRPYDYFFYFDNAICYFV